MHSAISHQLQVGVWDHALSYLLPCSAVLSLVGSALRRSAGGSLSCDAKRLCVRHEHLLAPSTLEICGKGAASTQPEPMLVLERLNRLGDPSASLEPCISVKTLHSTQQSRLTLRSCLWSEERMPVGCGAAIPSLCAGVEELQ